MARARRLDDEDDFDDRPRRPRRDDDEDNRPARREPAPNNAPKILAIVGGVFVVMALICGGIGLYIYNSIAKGVNQAQKDLQQNVQQNMEKMKEEQAKAQAEEANSDKAKSAAAVTAFLQEARADRPEAAYKMTSADYRKRVSEAEFAELIAANAKDLKSGFLNVRPDLFAPNKGTTYAYEVWLGPQTANVTAINENGKWVIDRFTLSKR